MRKRMIFSVMMKCPDALERAIEDAAESEIGGIGDSEENYESYRKLVRETNALAGTWFRYGEYVKLTIDTEKKTCVVESV
jgi:hypothetical protein